MKHPLCTGTGVPRVSSELEFDTTCVRSVPTQMADNSELSGSSAGARQGSGGSARGFGLAAGFALAALVGVTVGGIRQTAQAADENRTRNSFQAAEASAPNVDSGQRIQACMAGEGTVCNALGVEIIDREGFSGPNAHAARVSFDRACKAGNPIGCNNLGVLLASANRAELDEEVDAQAAQFFRRACEGGSSDGCSNLGVMHENGWGVPAGLGKALDFYSRACESGNALGCSNLGALYARGLGVKRDLPRAQTLFDRACAAENQVACRNLAVVLAKSE